MMNGLINAAKAKRLLKKGEKLFAKSERVKSAERAKKIYAKADKKIEKSYEAKTGMPFSKAKFESVKEEVEP